MGGKQNPVIFLYMFTHY